MMAGRKIVGVVVVLLILSSSAAAQPRPRRGQPWMAPQLAKVRGPCTVAFKPDISLGDHPLQALDLYLPDEPNGAAVVVIHGGGWHGGDKRGMGMVSGLLASHGFVVASVNYRLSPQFHWPVHLRDCQLAVKWLKENAKQLGIQADRIGALGTSAGGHLAAMLALADGKLAAGCKVQAACNYFGPSYMPRHSAQSPRVRAILSAFIGGPPEQLPQAYEEASPLSHVDSNDPPVQICQGGRDGLVPPEQAKMLYEALKKAGVPTELILLENQGHGFISRLRVDAEVQDCFMRSVNWLKKWLLGQESEAQEGAAEE